MHVCMWAPLNHSAMWQSEDNRGIQSLVLPNRSLGLNVGGQTWQQVPLHTGHLTSPLSKWNKSQG